MRKIKVKVLSDVFLEKRPLLSKRNVTLATLKMKPLPDEKFAEQAVGQRLQHISGDVEYTDVARKGVLDKS